MENEFRLAGGDRAAMRVRQVDTFVSAGMDRSGVYHDYIVTSPSSGGDPCVESILYLATLEGFDTRCSTYDDPHHGTVVSLTVGVSPGNGRVQSARHEARLYLTPEQAQGVADALADVGIVAGTNKLTDPTGAEPNELTDLTDLTANEPNETNG